LILIPVTLVGGLVWSACGENGPVPVASVEVTPLVDTVRAGATIQLTATPKDADGNPLTGRAITWASDDEAVATVNSSTGLVTGEGNGAATITATSEGQSGAADVRVWVGVTGSWSGTLHVQPDCQVDLSITEAATGTITGTSHLFAPCFEADFAVTGTNHTGGLTDSVAMDFVSGGVEFEFDGLFDGDATMNGVVYPGPAPATITRQSLSPAPPAPAAARADARSQRAASPWVRRTGSGR
jgi:hypothetical protein